MSRLPRTRVKICGITRVGDALAAAHAGADAIGLVFYPPSPRHLSVEQARQIVAALPPFVSVVGLFVDEEPERVRQVMTQLPLDLLQFHGEETPDYCRQFGRRYMKAVRMRDDVDLHAISRDYADASALLVDAYVPDRVGGTGKTFDWQRLPANLDSNLILAGGLDADNIGSAIRQVRPWGVDVSGGVELIDDDGRRHGGIKSEAAIRAFMEGVDSDQD